MPGVGIGPLVRGGAIGAAVGQMGRNQWGGGCGRCQRIHMVRGQSISQSEKDTPRLWGNQARLGQQGWKSTRLILLDHSGCSKEKGPGRGRNESEETGGHQWWLAVGWREWMGVGWSLHHQISAHRRPSLPRSSLWSLSQLTELPLMYRKVGILSTLLNEEEWKIINANMHTKKTKNEHKEPLQQAGMYCSFIRPEAKGQFYKWNKHM